jgi:MoaA/NifB/PqqE/SkfB family radical SAM enzyme
MLVHDFKNTKWTISVDSIGSNYEYVRYPGIWSEFLKNLKQLKTYTNNIDFNMTWSLLNPYEIFEAVDFLEDLGFADSTFIIQPVFDPTWLFIKNLPDCTLDNLRDKITERLGNAKSELYRNSLNSMLSCLNMPWVKEIKKTKQQLEIINQRRQLRFPESLQYVHQL